VTDRLRCGPLELDLDLDFVAVDLDLDLSPDPTRDVHANEARTKRQLDVAIAAEGLGERRQPDRGVFAPDYLRQF